MSDFGFDLGRRLHEREQANLRRELTPAKAVAPQTRFADDPKAGDVAFGEQKVVFGANNYLGLANDDRVKRATERAARTVGTGAGASRLVTGDTGVHRALERDLADCKETERALVFSSGYAANIGTITALDPDVVFSDAHNHASIIDGCRLADAETVVYDHCDAEALRSQMAERADTADDSEAWLVVTDSVFSMGGDVAPIEAICDAAADYGAWLLVDEAHATGIFDDGGGIVQREGLSDRVDIQLGTLSKALASQGGYVAGDGPLIEFLLNTARSFVFSTGLAPPSAAAARRALEIARTGDKRTQLWQNVETLREGLEAMGYTIRGETHILPVMLGDRETAMAVGDRLEAAGIAAPPIRPPTVPVGTSRIRVAPMATHTSADLARCLDAFERAGEEAGVL
jgi:8-amino-7-oxononanoate synthase